MIPWGNFYINNNEKEIIQGEVYKDDEQTAELFQHEGFHHIPEKGSEGILIHVVNGENLGITICPRRKDAIDSSPGDTILYATKNGKPQCKIELLKDGSISIEATNNQDINIKGKNINLNGTSKNLVTYAELNQALKEYSKKVLVEFTKLTSLVGKLGSSYVLGDVSIDISKSKSEKVKTSW